MVRFVKLIFTLALAAAITSKKCHHKNSTNSSGTPSQSADSRTINPSGQDNKVSSTNGTIYGLGYNAKHSDGNCPTQEKVTQDFQHLKTVTNRLRTFGLRDCSQGEMLVKAAQATGMKLSLGLFVNNFTQEFDQEFQILQDLTQKYKETFKSNIESVIVSSESIYRKEQTHQEIADKVNKVKKFLHEQGLPTLTTAADVKDNWYPSPLVDAVDVMFVNAYPFWENISIETAVDHLFNRIQEVKTRVNSPKRLILGETGWPEGGKSMAPAIPSKENQIKYFNEFYCRAKKENLEYYWFSAYDEAWKQGEQDSKWGLFLEGGQLKPGYTLPPKCP